MPLTAILLVLISSVMHAGWNLACKLRTPSAAFFVLSTGSSVAVMTPLYLWFAPRIGEIPLTVWGLMLGTGLAHALYYTSLGHAYRLTDISLAYPMLRSLPVLAVPLVGGLLGYGAPLSALAITGMITIAAGCMILPLVTLNSALLRHYLRLPFLFVVLAAVGTTGYSIMDSQGLVVLRGGEIFSPLEAALFYISFENLAILGFLSLHVVFSRRERANLRHIRENSLRYPLLSGPTTTSAYLLVLLAMQIASNVSYVVAFRQISILIGVMLGVMVLKEQPTRYKLIGTALIFTGLVLAALGS